MAPLILGINAYHADAAACIVRDGKLLAAAEEERFRRIKHWAEFPSQAIQYCLREAKVELADVTHVAVNRNSRANLLRKLRYTALHRPNVRLLLKRLRNRQQMAGIADELRALPGRPFAGKIEHVEHHLAHLASAFFASPFGQAVVVSVDGFATLPAQHGGAGRARRCRSTAVCCFRTRLASSIKR
jgi:carbamoyltransferase